MVYFLLMVKKQNIFHFLFINRGPDTCNHRLAIFSIAPRWGIDGGMGGVLYLNFISCGIVRVVCVSGWCSYTCVIYHRVI